MISLEQIDDQATDLRIFGQCLFNVIYAERHTELAHITGVRAQNRDLVPVRARTDHQFIKRIVLHLAVPDFRKRLFKILFYIFDDDRLAGFGSLKEEIVNPD